MKQFVGAVLIGIFALCSSASFAAEDQPFQELRFLTPAIANKIVVAAVADCTARGYKVSAAVVGRDGNLAAFLRNPLSGPHTIKVSQAKAYTAATFQAATSQVTNRPDLKFAPGILIIVGGVPINAGGYFYGAVAVSGAEPEIDEVCAQIGIDAVSEILEFAD